MQFLTLRVQRARMGQKTQFTVASHPLLPTSTTPPGVHQEPLVWTPCFPTCPATIFCLHSNCVNQMMPFPSSDLSMASHHIQKEIQALPFLLQSLTQTGPAFLTIYSATNYCILATLAYFQLKSTKSFPSSGYSCRLFLLPRKFFSAPLHLNNSHIFYNLLECHFLREAFPDSLVYQILPLLILYSTSYSFFS